MSKEIKEAMDVLTNALKNDPSYRIGWQANIAMSFKDEFNNRNISHSVNAEVIHDIANTAADNFLNLLCMNKNDQMIVSIIVAKSINNVIGKDNALPWKNMSADMKRFKAITMGHHMIMGRKTFESIGKPLPGRTSIIVTRDKNYQAPEGCIVTHSIEEAISVAKDNGETEAFIIGGADIILQSEIYANKMYLTYIREEFEGDVFLEHSDKWKLEKNPEHHEKDEKNPYDYSFINLIK